MTCVFCNIASGVAAAHTVWESPEALAFLDRSPLFVGHVLLVPRAHVPTLTELPESAVGPIFVLAQRLATAVQTAMGAQGTFVAMNNHVSQSVPHLHVHIVPRTKGDGLKGFFWPRTKYRDEAHMEEAAAAIRLALAPMASG